MFKSLLVCVVIIFCSILFISTATAAPVDASNVAPHLKPYSLSRDEFLAMVRASADPAYVHPNAEKQRQRVQERHLRNRKTLHQTLAELPPDEYAARMERAQLAADRQFNTQQNFIFSQQQQQQEQSMFHTLFEADWNYAPVPEVSSTSNKHTDWMKERAIIAISIFFPIVVACFVAFFVVIFFVMKGSNHNSSTHSKGSSKGSSHKTGSSNSTNSTGGGSTASHDGSVHSAGAPYNSSRTKPAISTTM